MESFVKNKNYFLSNCKINYFYFLFFVIYNQLYKAIKYDKKANKGLNANNKI